jgi:hypothetical protein
MSALFKRKKTSIAEGRRRNKKSSDMAKKQTFKHNVNTVFNTFYKNQVTALYKEVCRDK